MEMFYRNIIDELRIWKEKKDRKPLVLRGARQVGKTTLVNIFAKDFKCFVSLNLEKSEDNQIFKSDRPFNVILESIFFLKQKVKAEGSTLVFIDEIQNSPQAISLLRYFYEESPDIHVIAAGSLLETILGRNISFPVGRVEYLAVRPCSFKEFLVATGEKPALEALKSSSFPDYAHSMLQGLFNRYTLIGGMPEIISKYTEKREIVPLSPIFQSLIAGFSDDVEKYAVGDSSVKYIRHIINAGFRYGGQKIKFERFGESDYRSREMGEAFRTLEKTMLIELVYPSSSVQLPLFPNFKKSPRLHWLDTGLLNYSAGIQKEVFLATDLNSIWRGIVAEHIAGQELIAYDYNVLSRRSFWIREEKNSNAEIDYLVIHNDKLIPIEVKSGSGNTLKSLHLFMEKSSVDIAVRIWDNPFLVNEIVLKTGRHFKLVNIPFYMIPNLKFILDKQV